MRITRRSLFNIIAAVFSAAPLIAERKPRPPRRLKVWTWGPGWVKGCPFSEEEGFIILGRFGEGDNSVWAANFPVRYGWQPKLRFSDCGKNHFRYREHCGAYLEFSYPHKIVMGAL